MQRPIGVLGGTFNPVHNGHLAMAEAALREYNLSGIVFLPNGNPPHKGSSGLLSTEHRFNMISLAIAGNPLYEISDYELKRTERSYTIDTQRVLKGIYGENLYFIIGADSLYTINTWKSYEQLINECSFIVADRECSEGSDLYTACARLNEIGGNFKLLKMPRVDVTSTIIRKTAAAGKDLSGYVPPGVAEYIIKNNLYRS